MNDCCLKIFFWPEELNSNNLVLVLPNQAGERYFKTTFLRESPEVRYSTGHWTKSTRVDVLLEFTNDLLLPYNGKVANSRTNDPKGEEAWLDYYISFAAPEDKLNFLLSWT
jgi:hypothetical protein